MNRYQRQRLVLKDPDLGDVPVSGIYRTGNNQDFAQAVAAVYDLEVTTDGSEIEYAAGGEVYQGPASTTPMTENAGS